MGKSDYLPLKYRIPYNENNDQQTKTEQPNFSKLRRKNLFTELKRPRASLNLEESNPAGHCVF